MQAQLHSGRRRGVQHDANDPAQQDAGLHAISSAVARSAYTSLAPSHLHCCVCVCVMTGLDLYFLNRATMLSVTSSQQLHDVFASPAAGLTPITPVLQHVLQAKKAIALERKLLVVIATDGAPTNPQGQVDTAGLRHVLEAERNTDRVHVQFVACTDDNSTVAYLNEWDRQIKNLDVVDDYHSERKEILKAQGSSFKFSFGDYIVKTLLGSIDPEFDKLGQPHTHR